MPQPVKVDLAALPAGHAVCASPVVQVDQGEGKPKRWRLNSGARMKTQIGGIGRALLIIDLAGVTFEHPEFSMLREHGRQPATEADENAWYVNPIGRWMQTAVDATGIYGVPNVYTPESPLEEKMHSMLEGAEVAALIKRGHPWQASVRIIGDTADYELVAPGQSAVVNGRTEVADDDLDAPPLLICRRCVVTEASVCLFGADSQTGAVAASRTTTQATETTMSDRLEALLKRHGNKHAGAIAIALAAKKTDDQISAELSDAQEADHKAALAAKDAELAKLTEANAALTKSVTEMQTKLEALKTDDDKEDEEKKTPAATAGESKNSAPKSVLAGMAILTKEGSKLTGFKLRAAALSRFPKLRETLPKA